MKKHKDNRKILKQGEIYEAPEELVGIDFLLMMSTQEINFISSVIAVLPVLNEDSPFLNSGLLGTTRFSDIIIINGKKHSILFSGLQTLPKNILVGPPILLVSERLMKSALNWNALILGLTPANTVENQNDELQSILEESKIREINDIKNHLAHDQLNKALELLEELCEIKAPSLTDDVILVKRRYNKVQRGIRIGALDYIQSSREETHISLAIMSILSEISI